MKKLGLFVVLVAASLWACGSTSSGGNDAGPGTDTVQGDVGDLPSDVPGGTDATPDGAVDTLTPPDSGDLQGLDSTPSDTVPQDTQAIDTTQGDIPGADTMDPTFTANIQPLLDFHCGACHGGTESINCSGVTCFATVYEHNLMNSVTCPGKTVGECSLQRIEAGQMPPECPTCVTEEDKALIQSWIDAGMPE
jgi:hypothetical protein